MNVGPYVPLPRKAAERRCYLKYIAVDEAPGFLCVPYPWPPDWSRMGVGQIPGAQAWQGWLLCLR